ncbi:MAG: hypothetical protein WAW73_17825 [Rhodoferax sp.]
MSETDDLALFPQWKQAVQDFLATFTYGDLVPHEWLVEHFGMPPLKDSQKLTAADFRRRQFDLLANTESFKHALLEQHQIFLQAVRGEGYRWSHPGEQTALATKEFERDAKRAFRSAGQRLRNVRLTELTDDQRRENTDAIAKVSALRGMARKALR